MAVGAKVLVGNAQLVQNGDNVRLEVDAGVVTGEEGGTVELAEGAATTVTLNEILSGSDTYTATLNAILKGANTINQVTAGTYTYTDGSWVLKPAA